METTAWRIAAVTGAALLLPLMLLPGGLLLEPAWVSIATAAFVATRVGLRLHPPVHRGAHGLISTAAGLIAVAAALELRWISPSPSSGAVTLAAVLYLASFVLLAVAMFRFVTMRMPTGDADGLIDSALVAIATAAVMFDVLTDPAVTGVYSGTSSIAYAVLPLLMAGVLASIVRVLLTGAHRYLSAWLFLGAAVCSVSSNVLFLTVAPDPTDLRLRPLFYGGYVLLACAALHRPTPASPNRRRTR